MAPIFNRKAIELAANQEKERKKVIYISQGIYLLA